MNLCATKGQKKKQKLNLIMESSKVENFELREELAVLFVVEYGGSDRGTLEEAVSV